MVSQEKERRRAAQEIHDSLGASLAATKYKIEATLSQLGDTDPQTIEALKSIIPIVQGTVDEARRIQMALRPSILDDLGLLATIGWFCRRYESTYSHIRIRQEINLQESEAPDSLKTAIFRVLQEAMSNIAKNSKATRVLLALRKTDQAIQLVVQDNGHGFDSLTVSKIHSNTSQNTKFTPFTFPVALFSMEFGAFSPCASERSRCRRY